MNENPNPNAQWPTKFERPFYAPSPMAMPIVFENIFNPYECDQIIEYIEDHPDYYQPGKVGVSRHPDDPSGLQEDVRNVDTIPVQMHFHDQLMNEIWQKINYAVYEINRQNFQFEILHCQQMELAKYSPPGGKYVEHVDCGATEASTMRKLSFSVQLNDPDSFDGGKLTFSKASMGIGESEQKKIPQGAIVVFPSFLVHSVEPVTEGTRYSMFGWFDGPRFK